MENNKVETKNSAKTIGYAFWFVVFLVGVFYWLGSLTNSSAANPISDINNFSNYHKQLVIIEKPLDIANDDYQKESKIALKNADLYALYNSAKNLNDATSEALFDLSHLAAPELNNKNAEESLNALQDNFNIYIGSLKDMSSTVMTMANSGNVTPELARNIEDNAKVYQSASINMAINIIKTYAALGVKDINQIDIENGGLTTSKTTTTNPQS
jgi:hypothetical protein